jgi:two-component system, OmpR family, sensor histidine kinase BaeS
MNITSRLFLALLGATGAVVLCMFLLLQWSMDRGFLRYVNTVEQIHLENMAVELEAAYQEHGSWNFLRDDPWRWLRKAGRERLLITETQPRGNDSAAAQRPKRQRPPRSSRLILLDAARQPLFGPERPDDVPLRNLRVDGQVVGYLGMQPRERLADLHELHFVKGQRLAMGLVAMIIFLVSAGLALPLSKRLLRPVRQLGEASNLLAAGHYASRVPVTSRDELGHLAEDFNTLARTLEKNEQARRSWLADISHELRTPLAILRGEIEAIEDGLRQPTAEAIRSLHGEVMRLGRLVDDLQQLSLSDLGALTYRKKELELVPLLTDVIDSYRPELARNGLHLQVELPRRSITIFADSERLRQLFSNLLENALKYTDRGGQVEVCLAAVGDQAKIDIRDSAPSVATEDLQRLFERFYRVEGSRNRASGGAGLGLAICRNIVEAHDGSISARPSPLGGLWLEVRLPLGREGR